MKVYYIQSIYTDLDGHKTYTVLDDYGRFIEPNEYELPRFFTVKETAQAIMKDYEHETDSKYVTYSLRVASIMFMDGYPVLFNN